jgi:hypothetical protein
MTSPSSKTSDKPLLQLVVTPVISRIVAYPAKIYSTFPNLHLLKNPILITPSNPKNCPSLASPST